MTTLGKNIFITTSNISSTHFHCSFEDNRKTAINKSSCERNEEILKFQYLLRCSFHAYADSTYAKHLENGASLYGTVGAPTPTGTFQPNGEVPREFQQSVMEMSDDSMTSLDPHQLHHAAAAGAAGPHDWAGPAGGQLVQTTANISPVVAGAGAELRPANGGVFGHNQQQQQQDNGECGAGPTCSVVLQKVPSEGS